MNMTRKEKQKAAADKRRAYKAAITKVIIEAITSGNSIVAAGNIADKFIEEQIKKFPQDKSLILSARIEWREDFKHRIQKLKELN